MRGGNIGKKKWQYMDFEGFKLKFCDGRIINLAFYQTLNIMYDDEFIFYFTSIRLLLISMATIFCISINSILKTTFFCQFSPRNLQNLREKSRIVVS